MSIVLFAYDFPHRKSHDFMLSLFLHSFEVDCVIGAPRVNLGGLRPSTRVKPRLNPGMSPRHLCEKLGYEYVVVPHGSAECIQLLKERRLAIGLVAGARILPPSVIELFSKGIVNFHPGLIPEARGLDAMQWSLTNQIPLGVTAHYIDKRVDAGRIIEKRQISLYEDDTLIDLSLRLYETQVEMLPEVLSACIENDPASLPSVGKSKPNKKMPEELEKQLSYALAKYKAKFLK